MEEAQYGYRTLAMLGKPYWGKAYALLEFDVGSDEDAIPNLERHLRLLVQERWILNPGGERESNLVGARLVFTIKGPEMPRVKLKSGRVIKKPYTKEGMAETCDLKKKGAKVTKTKKGY